jgi:lipoprotein-anchoring transpeptidase ErfK/SrfK
MQDRSTPHATPNRRAAPNVRLTALVAAVALAGWSAARPAGAQVERPAPSALGGLSTAATPILVADTAPGVVAPVRPSVPAPGDSLVDGLAEFERAELVPRHPLDRFTLDVSAINLPLTELAERPVGGGDGPEVLQVQILLDAAGFSPGMLDAKWNENTLFALRAFRDARGLGVGDVVDEPTYAALRAATARRPAVTSYTVSAEDLKGPFRAIPRDVSAKARLSCLCYQSALERLTERFHATPGLMRALNPGVDFAKLTPGQTLTVPNAAARAELRAPLARVVVYKKEGSVRGFSKDGKPLFWLPATVGSTEMPSPHGKFAVTSVTRDPHYRWDPAVLKDVPRSRGVLMLPPGPNSLVGPVWVALSKPHVGIHGTPDPDLVGYAASHGCVRLTNWDALWFSRIARPGLAVEFR